MKIKKHLFKVLAFSLYTPPPLPKKKKKRKEKKIKNIFKVLTFPIYIFRKLKKNF